MTIGIDQIEFGDEVSDVVTGFVGVVTAKALYATGCNQVSVQPPVKKDGSYVESRWFDIERIKLEVAGKTTIIFSATGGPRGAETAPSR